MVNSRQKGARGERELSKKLIELFDLDHAKTYRGCQFSGSKDSPDIKTEMDEIWHIECKRVNKLNLHNAVEQSVRDSGEGQTPVVIHRADNRPWLITVRLDDFPDLIKKISKFKSSK